MESIETIIHEFKERLAKSTDQELVEHFNSQVGIRAWGNARARFLEALRQELLKQELDCSSFLNSSGMSLKYPLRLVGRKLVQVQNDAS